LLEAFHGDRVADQRRWPTVIKISAGLPDSKRIAIAIVQTTFTDNLSTINPLWCTSPLSQLIHGLVVAAFTELRPFGFGVGVVYDHSHF